MKEVLDFKDFINNYKEPMLSEADENESEDDNIPDNTVPDIKEPETTEEPSSDSQKPKKTVARKAGDKSDALDTGVGKYYTGKFSLYPEGATSDDKMNDLQKKYLLVIRTAKELLSTFSNNTNYTNTDNIENGVVKLLSTSLQTLKNDFNNWLDTDYAKSSKDREKYLLRQKKSRRLTKDDLETIRANEEVEDLILYTYEDIISEGLVKPEWIRKIQGTNTNMIGSGKFSPENILKTATKRNNVWALDKDFVEDFFRDYTNRAQAIYDREIRNVNNNLKQVDNNLKKWSNIHSYLKTGDASFISATTTYLYSAWGKLKGLASLLNTVLSQCQNSINVIKREAMKDINALYDASHSKDVEKSIARAEERLAKKDAKKTEKEAELKVKEAEKTASEKAAEAEKEADKNAEDALKAAQIARRTEAKKADSEKKLNNYNNFRDNFESNIEKYNTLEKVANDVITLAENPEANIEGLNGDIDAKAKTLYAFFILNKLGQKKKDFILNNQSRLSKTLDLLFKYSNKNGKSLLNEILKAIAKKSSKNKVGITNAEKIAALLASDVLKTERTRNVETAGKEAEAAKDFDNEEKESEPKNIFDYAVMKAKKANE